MKLSKPQIRAHESACALLDKERLTYEEKLYVYDNWYPSYSNQIGKIASFFTPIELASTVGLAMDGCNTVVDLCAGIGILSFLRYHQTLTWERREIKVTCIENNPEFVSAGKKLFPEANWILGDVLDEDLIKSLGRFRCAISNPPYGNIKTGNNKSNWFGYSGNEFEFKVISVASKIADYGVFILPQGSAPFVYSGRSRGAELYHSDKYQRWSQQTGMDLQMCIGIDTAEFKDDWKGTSILTEVADIEFNN